MKISICQRTVMAVSRDEREMNLETLNKLNEKDEESETKWMPPGKKTNEIKRQGRERKREIAGIRIEECLERWIMQDVKKKKWPNG